MKQRCKSNKKHKSCGVSLSPTPTGLGDNIQVLILSLSSGSPWTDPSNLPKVHFFLHWNEAFINPDCYFTEFYWYCSFIHKTLPDTFYVSEAVLVVEIWNLKKKKGCEEPKGKTVINTQM